MTLVSGKITNFKKLKDVKFNVNKKTFFIIGDTGEGKTSLLTAILSSIMVEDFPEDPVTTGEDAGEVSMVHEFEGRLYTFRRAFVKGKKSRWTCTDEIGGRHTPSDVLERMLGKAFVNNYFDYNQFFHKQKSTDARTEYLIKSVSGDKVFENIAKINKLTRERGPLGTEKDRLEKLIDQSGLNPDTLEEDVIKYAEEKTTEEALKIKNDTLLTRKSIINLTNQLKVVREENETYKLSEESLAEVNDEIAELERLLTAANEKKKNILQYQEDFPPDFETQAALEKELETVEEDNKDIEEKADLEYNRMVMDVNTFNLERKELSDAIINYDLFLEASSSWQEKDDEINRLKAENKELFASRLPIPGMTIEEYGEEGKLMVMYDGREFCYENLSKGKSLRLTMEIQRFLNPKGNNFIVIPEAQSLGSELDDILQECKDHNIQAIVEVTERKQKFQIKFEEDYL